MSYWCRIHWYSLPFTNIGVKVHQYGYTYDVCLVGLYYRYGLVPISLPASETRLGVVFYL